MSENEEDRLEKILELAEENNRMLRSMHRRMLWSQVFTFIYWAIILGAMTWSYYLLEPYMAKYWGMFQTLSNQLTGLESSALSIPKDLEGLLEKVR